MKATLILLIFVLLAIMPVAEAQEKPVSIFPGALFSAGSTTKFIMMGGGNYNVMSKQTSGEVTAQIIMRETIFYSDNVTGDEFEGVGSYFIAQIFKGNWKFGAGTGFTLEMQTGGNSVMSAFVTEALFSPFEWVDIGVHFQYLPATGPDYQILAAGLSIKMPE